MSRRAAIVEEFDDDTDLPLPSKPLFTGTRGPILQEINDDDDDDDDYGAGPASPPNLRQFSSSQHQWSSPDSDSGKKVTDITPYKTWTCIYPIYLDAKRPYGTGQRRVSRSKAVWWPLSKDIADAAGRLGLGSLHEITKTHPRDWENPGRVRVQWKKEGKLVNSAVKTKKQLLEMICYQLQLLKPENIPKSPYSFGKQPISAPPLQKMPDNSQNQPPPTAPSTSAPKGKPSISKHQPSHSHQEPPTPKAGTTGLPNHSPKPVQRRVAIPPDPYPPVSSRLSGYSPVVASGVLIDTVKAGMNAQAEASAGAGQNTTPASMAKGKRKVIRVRQ